LAANDEGLAAMAASGTIAVCLPATAYSLRKPYARARHMVDLGVPVAAATDCNPGSCFCDSMPFVFGLSVMAMGLSVEETLVASTLNGAYAVGRAASAGSLEPGKAADFLVLDGETPAILAYHAGGDCMLGVYKRGEAVA
jgi:imidazolonepropionase